MTEDENDRSRPPRFCLAGLPTCTCGFDRTKPGRIERLPDRNAALWGVGVHPSISENA